MKYLPLILLIFLFSCSDDDPIYRDLTGEWKFSKGDISGTLNIVGAGDQYFGVLPGSTFKIAGIEYVTKNLFTVDMDSDLRLITLADEGMKNYILLGNGNNNDSFSRMNYTEAVWGTNCESGICETEGSEEKITFKRK